jgi:hypothetical protein
LERKLSNIVSEVSESWGWVGLEPKEVIAENEFGNLIIKDTQGQFWRLCPEDVYCEVIAATTDEYNLLIKDQEFMEDWLMLAMVEKAKISVGTLAPGYKYHMVIPGILGGEYGGENVKSAPLTELVRFSGNLGKQINELPDGAEIELKVVK